MTTITASAVNAQCTPAERGHPTFTAAVIMVCGSITAVSIDRYGR